MRTMVSSHARGFPPANPAIPACALRQASCTTSSASAVLPVSQRASDSASPRCGSTTSAKRAASIFSLNTVPPSGAPAMGLPPPSAGGDDLSLLVRVKIATAGDGACFEGGEGIGVTGVKCLGSKGRLGRGRRIARCNGVLAVMVVDLDGCDRHGSGPAAGRYRPKQVRPAPALQRPAPAEAFAPFSPCVFVFVPLHDGLLLLRTNGACPGDRRTGSFIPGRSAFSFTLT
ncbi:hypothetical protein MPL3365_10154 [Mesorhizobium plurifarium]|uniref:Uncharacterized protein n=1 Tax=Mesorhizobium plurifarium TaxID=69974 RepID=A0A090G036_MESPL|nr:hypothetical protein MPL3365_10154 [Mesorhizobium plurifarium]